MCRRFCALVAKPAKPRIPFYNLRSTAWTAREDDLGLAPTAVHFHESDTIYVNLVGDSVEDYSAFLDLVQELLQGRNLRCFPPLLIPVHVFSFIGTIPFDHRYPLARKAFRVLSELSEFTIVNVDI